MSFVQPDAPIQRLDTDLLLYITRMNADMFSDDKALGTTLSTSRVCRAWRLFMLNTPSIWARLIDLDRLHGCTPAWTHELFRRSGTAFLWMKAHGCMEHTLSHPNLCSKYALDIISNNWSRLQRLEASFDTRYVESTQWEHLYLSTPHLESLFITLERGPDNPELPPFLSLLGGDAPLLRKFRFRGHTKNLTAPWLCRLHSLELNNSVTLSEALKVLMLTKNLVNLRLEHTVMEDMNPTSSLPHVELPKLAHLEIRIFAYLRPGVTLLDRIQIPPSCSLLILIQPLDPNEILREGPLYHIIHLVSMCAQHHFTHHMPRELSLQISLEKFAVTAGSLLGQPTFLFGADVSYSSCPFLPKCTFSTLLKEFTLSGFHSITKFELLFFHLNLRFPEMIAFATCLPLIDTIICNDLALDPLIFAQESLKTAAVQNQVAFPKLKYLKINPEPPSFLHEFSDRLSTFLTNLKLHGCLIDLLDLTCDSAYYPPKMEFLKEGGDMKVLWRISKTTDTYEYNCHTGTFRYVKYENV